MKFLRGSCGRPMLLLMAAIGFSSVTDGVQAQGSAPASVTTAPQSSGLAASGYTVTGRVLCADTQRPARFAQVNLIPATEDGEFGGRGGGRGSARTDLEGDFSIGGVAPGDYYVAGQLAGYVNVTQEVQAALNAGGDMASALAGVPMVHVGPGGGSADVSLQRGGVIAGTVVWDDGSPAGSVQVSAQPAPATGVQGTGVTQGIGSGFGRGGFGGYGGYGGGQTDDRGRFRLTGLLPGTYLVRASVQAPLPQKAASRGFAPILTVAVYAPDKYRRTDAVPVTLTAGEEREDLGITLGMAGLHAVSGTVSSSGGTVRSGSINLTDSSDSTLNRTGIINADGSFTVPYVPAGSYTLQARASSQAASGGRGGSAGGSSGGGPQFQPLQMAVTVTDSDVAGLSLNVTPVTTAAQ